MKVFVDYQIPTGKYKEEIGWILNLTKGDFPSGFSSVNGDEWISGWVEPEIVILVKLRYPRVKTRSSTEFFWMTGGNEK